MTYSIEVEEDVAASTLELDARLQDFNEYRLGPRNTERFVLAVRDRRGVLLGGLAAEVFWNAMYVSHLWVSESERGRGLGSSLMRRAEQRARERPCDVIFLNTMSFQAPDVHRRLGFARVGGLPNAPRGCSRLWFAKTLASGYEKETVMSSDTGTVRLHE